MLRPEWPESNSTPLGPYPLNSLRFKNFCKIEFSTTTAAFDDVEGSTISSHVNAEPSVSWPVSLCAALAAWASGLTPQKAAADEVAPEAIARLAKVMDQAVVTCRAFAWRSRNG